MEPTGIRTDTFYQVARPQYDFLWIIDNTRSMGPAQDAMVDLWRGFYERIDAAGIAWQIGVVTTDLTTDGGILTGDPWIITPDTPGGAETFVRNARVGTEGDGANLGLGALRTALSPPLTYDENQGFLRTGARLRVYVVSDSDDATAYPGGGNEVPVSDFVTFLAGLKSELVGMPAFTAIVGPRETGCQGQTVSATAGDRYVELALATGGVPLSICAPGEALLREDLTLPPRIDTFSLAYEPASDAIGVWVNAARAPEGTWTVVDQTLRFGEDHVPDYDAEIRVQYLYDLPAESP